jgi:SAM-dependent methyltransferase
MNEQVYKDMAEQQDRHWWFKARQAILARVIHEFFPKKTAKILEIGCGTGGNLKMLENYGQIFAMEMDEFSCEFASNRAGIRVKRGWLPDNIPFDEKFDLICMFDVLEHIEADQEALQVLKRILAPEGIVILTVPAYQWLYGPHDKLLHHFRRYSKKSLKLIIQISDFKLLHISHMNTILFPLVVGVRLLDMIKKTDVPTGYAMPGKNVNKILFTLFNFERYFVNKINFPYGASLITIFTPN